MFLFTKYSGFIWGIIFAAWTNDFKVEKIELSQKYLIKLTINSQDSGYITYTSGEALKPFTYLDAKEKIKLIEALLSFEGDSSVCYNKIYCFWPQYYRGDIPVSVKYELQVEALHMINFVAFTDASYPYSPFPVLYDKKTKKEITGHSRELSDIFSFYKAWFATIKKKGFVNYGFPLANSPYKWFGSLDRKIAFKKYRAWQKDTPGDIKSN